MAGASPSTIRPCARATQASANARTTGCARDVAGQLGLEERAEEERVAGQLEALAAPRLVHRTELLRGVAPERCWG
jgi:hypothetical protein